MGAGPGLVLTDPKTTGLAFTNLIPEARHLTNQILLNGSGVAAGDVDGDGWTDVFFAGFDNDSALFRNRGAWTFENVTDAAGLALEGYDCTGAAFADLDGDGDLDLVVNTLAGGTLLLTNDGRGVFRQSGAPLIPGRGAMTAALADVDADGDLDLYVANYRTRALMDMPNTRMTFKKIGGSNVVDTVNGRPASDPEFFGRFSVNAAGGIEEHGEPDVLFRNEGAMRFVEVPWTSGAFLDEAGKPLTSPPRDWGLAAMFRDLDGDGRPDLYVCNDFQSPDRLWLNQGGGRFRLASALALRRTSLSSMAVDFADLNRDGHDDFIVLEMMSRDHAQRMRWVRENFPHQPVVGVYDDRPQLEQNTLQLGRGDGTWAEVAQLAGLEATEWAWGCAFVDLDLDGWEDVLVVNGMERAARDLDVADRIRSQRQGRKMTDADIFQARRQFPRLATPNLAFRNQGDLTFRDTSRAWGFDLSAVSQALALADLDNDGDLDVLVGNSNEAVAVYRNDAPAPRVAVRLAGRAPNTRGIGARIQVFGDLSLPVQSQEMIAGGRYLSGDDPVRTFAAPGSGTLRIRVRWPRGAVTEVAGVRPNTLLEIGEPETVVAPPPPDPRPSSPIRFEDLSPALAHRHHEEAFDEFARQPLLPRKLGQSGPGVAWADLDEDGDEDLVVGTGANGRVAAFRNQGSGKFEPWRSAALGRPIQRDTTGMVVLPTPGKPTVLAATANYEDGATLGASVVAWDPVRDTLTDLASADESSPGALALADIDRDGDLDLFVGGQVVPGRWPAPAASRFFRQENGKFVVDKERSRAVSAIGLVSGALFSDIDTDGDSDLVLAVDGGRLTVLRQESAGFVDATEAVGLGATQGGWISVAAGDFDGDGRIDLVAGNWGRNTPYERDRSSPDAAGVRGGGEVRVYHGDFDKDGVYDALEAVWEASLARFVPVQPLNTLASGFPSLRGRFASHAEFAMAGVEDLLGAAVREASVLRWAVFETMLFLNRGTRFEAVPLPVEAQFAPVFGIVVADADGDGNLDVFLAQNFFAVRPYAPRYDGGVGLWLRGDGRGGFAAVSPEASGVFVAGEQRGAACADFDGDGRMDFVVGQNGAETRLFRNVAAKPGLRVRLAGPPENPAGVGARVRWTAPTSPVREVHAGGGYLSQDSGVQVLARPEGAGSLEVVWPGNRRVVYAVPDGVAEVSLGHEGGVRSAR